MPLADMAKPLSSRKSWVESDGVDAAIRNLIDENADYYAERMSSLSMSQRLVVSALAREQTEDFNDRRSVFLGISLLVAG